MGVRVNRVRLADSQDLTAAAATTLRGAGPWGRVFRPFNARPLRAWRSDAIDRGRQPPPPARRKPVAMLWAAQIALALLIASTTGLLLAQLRDRALAEADNEMRGLSLILADQAERAFEAVDLVQTMFLSVVQAESIQTADAFRQRMSSRAVNKEMDDHGSALPQLDVIGVVDAEGNFLNISHTWPTPVVNISDRAHFKALKADPGLTVFVSDPIMNRLSHTLAVVVAHRISSPDRSFLGISFAGVLMSYFENLYQTVAGQPEMTIALLRTDGMLLARYPHPDHNVGKTYSKGELVTRLAQTGAESGAMQVISPFDGTPRLVAGHTLARYPMLVTVSRTLSSILAPWRQQAADLVGAAILLELVVATVVMLMLRHFRGQRMLAEARDARLAAESALELSQERERASHELHVQHVRFGAALDAMSQALCMFDPTGGLVVANRRMAGMFGLPGLEVTSGSTVDSMRELLTGSSNLQPGDIDMMQTSVSLLRADGKRADNVRELADGRSLAMNFAPMEDDGWLLTWEDITERRRVEAKVAYMAKHDALTGLPNRTLFHEKLAEAVARSRRREISAVLFLDLDRFKAVNDTLGHPAGDALLKEVTRRLLAQVRETDTVARLGGDEFAIVQAGIRSAEDATLLATRLIEAVSAPYVLDGQQANIGTSIGIAIIPDDAQNADQILKNADIALYRAKADGRGRYQYFEPAMDARIQARRAIELDLRQAMTNGDFEVFYQPLMNLHTRSVCGFEALIRWRHPVMGLLLPAEFIPIAEEIGLIILLGEWVLRQACRDAASWPNGFKVAVNLSPLQFGSHKLLDVVTEALEVSGLEPGRLELEITETTMLGDTDAVLVTLYLLRDLGVAIALDDFGTGYSSLVYLRRFPFNKVKIDRSFINGLGDGGDCNAIVAAVTNLCASMGMTTTAEGVETAEQLKQLAAWNCTEAQGFLFSHPRPAADVPDMCRSLGEAAIGWS